MSQQSELLEDGDPIPTPATAEEITAITHIEAVRAAASSGKGNPPAPIDIALRSTRPNHSHVVGKIIEGRSVVSDEPFHVSMLLDEQHVKGIEGYEDFKPYLAPALDALSVASEGLKSIDAAWQAMRKDSSKTPEQKALVIAPAAQKKHDAIASNFYTAHENLTKAVAHINQELDAPVIAAGTASATNAELRTVLRGMKTDERNALIDKAVRDGDTLIVTSVLAVHPLISGVDPLRHQMWTRTWREKHKPELVRRLNATKRAIEIVERCMPIAVGQVEAAMRIKFADVAKLKGMADASAAALAKLG